MTHEEFEEFQKIGADLRVADERLKRLDSEIELTEKLIAAQSRVLEFTRKEKLEALRELVLTQARLGTLNQTLGIQTDGDLQKIDGRYFVPAARNATAAPADPKLGPAAETAPRMTIVQTPAAEKGTG